MEKSWKRCGQSETDVIKVRIAHDNNVNTPLHKSFLKYEELVEEASNGEIDVVILSGGTMGSVQDTFEQCRRGDIEISGSTTSNFATAIPEFAVWESFGLFDDEAHAKRVLESDAGKQLMEPLERHNLVGMGYMELGFRNFSNSKRPIETLDDLKGLKIRGYNSIQIKAWEALGLNTTSVSWGELFTSLQQKMIDGQECAMTSFYTEKFYEAQDYWSLTRHVFTNYLWYANKDFMDSLSEEHRQILMDCAQEAIDYNWELNIETEQSTLDQLRAEGFAVNDVSLEVRREMGRIMNDAIREDIVALCGQEIYDMVMDTVEEQRQS
ncbi:MAG TPA: TRAP transporter substrate-binding protein [Candidatus Avoscillospira avistercoris]|uniref:TRAP transporter substrate-binding protein n=1 Tax=Candidatus Avoscillospira avistercoris TaxID=2840707 RepID=A0A9D1F8K9_9FIRM|nr:TRAP transporter substrate-binding protein [Candidatus Avoscillospira avistercoris]